MSAEITDAARGLGVLTNMLRVGDRIMVDRYNKTVTFDARLSGQMHRRRGSVDDLKGFAAGALDSMNVHVQLHATAVAELYRWLEENEKLHISIAHDGPDEVRFQLEHPGSSFTPPPVTASMTMLMACTDYMWAIHGLGNARYAAASAQFAAEHPG